MVSIQHAADITIGPRYGPEISDPENTLHPHPNYDNGSFFMGVGNLDGAYVAMLYSRCATFEVANPHYGQVRPPQYPGGPSTPDNREYISHNRWSLWAQVVDTRGLRSSGSLTLTPSASAKLYEVLVTYDEQWGTGTNFTPGWELIQGDGWFVLLTNADGSPVRWFDRSGDSVRMFAASGSLPSWWGQRADPVPGTTDDEKFNLMSIIRGQGRSLLFINRLGTDGIRQATVTPTGFSESVLRASTGVREYALSATQDYYRPDAGYYVQSGWTLLHFGWDNVLKNTQQLVPTPLMQDMDPEWRETDHYGAGRAIRRAHVADGVVYLAGNPVHAHAAPELVDLGWRYNDNISFSRNGALVPQTTGDTVSPPKSNDIPPVYAKQAWVTDNSFTTVDGPVIASVSFFPSVGI